MHLVSVGVLPLFPIFLELAMIVAVYAAIAV